MPCQNSGHNTRKEGKHISALLYRSKDEFVTALRARLRIPYPSFLPRFRCERGPAQQCNHQYSAGRTICGHRLTGADGTANVNGQHLAQSGTVSFTVLPRRALAISSVRPFRISSRIPWSTHCSYFIESIVKIHI